MRLEDYLHKTVVLRNGQEGKVIDIKPGKGLITIKLSDGSKTDRYPNNVSLKNGEMTVTGNTQDSDDVTPVTQRLQIPIDKKFEYMEQLVTMVARRQQPSVVITGEGGLGKTYTVNKALEANELLIGDHYVVIKGYSTAKGLYRTLYEHNDKIIIFDDCDEVLKNDVAKNILKSALDSYDTRIVSWISQSIGDELPQSFEFTGYIIFISNMSQDKIDQAVLSRSYTIDLSMSVDEKIQRMRTIMPKIRTDVSMEMKEEAMDLIEENKFQCSDLNMRTLIKTINIRQALPETWKEVAYFMLVS